MIACCETEAVVFNNAPEYVFDALSCKQVKTSAAYSGRSFCDPGKIAKETGTMTTDGKEMMSVVQAKTVRRAVVLKCEKRKSVLTAICGAFSHSKLTSPPDVMAPVLIPLAACAGIRDSLIYKTEDDRSLRVAPGAEVAYKYIETGAVTLSEHNVACEGGNLRVNGKDHDNIIRLVTVTLITTELEVLESEGVLRVNGVPLPRKCSLMLEGCELDEYTLAFDAAKINLCPYALVRVDMFQKLVDGSKQLRRSEQHKLMFELGDQLDIPHECLSRGRLWRTNFDRLFLFSGDLATRVDLIDTVTIDLELETRVVDYFLTYLVWEGMIETRSKFAYEICESTAGGLGRDQTMLHDNHVLKRQGEIILEFPCAQVTVRTRLGHKAEGGNCLDHLPVYLPDGTLEYLTPISRVLVQRDSVSIVNCSSHYPLIFEDKNRQLITANPDVQLLSVQLSQHHVADADSRNHSELFQFNSLLYTPEEVKAYESMLQGHSAEQSVTRKFASFYCEQTGECQPSVTGDNFNFRKLLDPTYELQEWWRKTQENIAFYGGLWACFCCLSTMFHTAYKLVRVWRSMGRRDLSKSALMKMMFLPGDQILSMYPPVNPQLTRDVELDAIRTRTRAAQEELVHFQKAVEEVKLLGARYPELPPTSPRKDENPASAPLFGYIK